MLTPTRSIAAYAKERGYTVRALSENTGIPYGRLQPCLKKDSTREMSSTDFLALCAYLEKNPMDFYQREEG